MLKKMERADGQSCWNRADDDEIVFVLLARDVAASGAIEAWCRERIRLGKNTENDHQIKEARRCASAMAAQQPGIRPV